MSRSSRRSRALALAGISLTMLASSACAHSGVKVSNREAGNPQRGDNGFVQMNYPHVTEHAPAAVPYPQVLAK